MNEKEIISLFLQEGEMDDCSSIPFSKNKIVTTDSMVENVHFRLDWSSPEDLAIKLFHINLSDLISSGAKAEWCLFNLGLPRKISTTKEGEHFLASFANTFQQECKQYQCPLIGGDTFRSKLLFLNLTMGGSCEGRRLRRSGGKPGDHLYLSGEIGFSLAGYLHLNREISLPDGLLKERALEKHLRPRARSKWAKLLWNCLPVHSLMDLSDCLYQDVFCLAEQSNLMIDIDLDSLPLADPSLADFISNDPSISDRFFYEQAAACSGEELELLFLGKPGLSFPFPFTAIGRAKRVTDPDIKPKEKQVRFLRKGEEVVLNDSSFYHFP